MPRLPECLQRGSNKHLPPCCHAAAPSHSPVTPPPSLQIYWATFGCVRAVDVDKAGRNVCHPFTSEIYLCDSRILPPLSRSCLSPRPVEAGGGGGGWGGGGDGTGLQTAYHHQFDTVDSKNSSQASIPPINAPGVL